MVERHQRLGKIIVVGAKSTMQSIIDHVPPCGAKIGLFSYICATWVNFEHFDLFQTIFLKNWNYFIVWNWMLKVMNSFFVLISFVLPAFLLTKLKTIFRPVGLKMTHNCRTLHEGSLHGTLLKELDETNQMVGLSSL